MPAQPMRSERRAEQPMHAEPTPASAVDQRGPAAAHSSETLEHASGVWQRIDAAHSQPVTHPNTRQARPTVAVSAPQTAPRRMQAAAPVAAPAATPTPLRMDPPAAPARHLPLVGDEVNATNDPQQTDTRRRTVADFLYAAGQYNPGRILATAEDAPAAQATAPVMRTADMMRVTDQAYDMPATNYASSSQQAARPMAPAPMATPAMDAPMIPEAMPRRTGQILRVDVPRGQNNTAMPVAPQSDYASETQGTSAGVMQSRAAQTQPLTQPLAQPQTQSQTQSQPQPKSQPKSQPMLDRSSLGASLESPVKRDVMADSPVAKYVLEQRRLDRAHQLNEVEEKLRDNTHKIFNPVWEVDNLQWPAVVDKLMHQRAQSMAHVAEHLKTACQDGLSVLGVTSANHGEGRTTVACCLARLAASHGLNVALVDIDLDHPTLCVQTNMEVEHDWRDCLSEDISLEEVAVHSIDDQLTVLPLKPRGGRPGLLASDSRIADILADLSECFELVIVDCSKTNSSGNIITGLAHTKIFDAAIVVVDRRDTQADRIEDAVRLIQQTGIESIGIVDNFSV